MFKFPRFLLSAALAILLAGAAACTPTQNVRGNFVADYQVTDVKPGVDNASDVMHKLGSPTARDPFDPNIWYYIGQHTEKRGILDPEIKDERILVAKFGPDGKLESLTDKTGERTDIPINRDKTPTSGNEVTFMQQLLGNLGRFNKDPMPGQ
jgi:outer membrane protein assembly factor BamE (lipoprotein component of BamABCDE complex)